ncbi:hypothetical protein VNO78_08096 [Psophocarpus tetragonolobus]|uniref:Uncharacterized protein n=1 Tax=Psophocarpus tetragonolobus TaxID=3891 RepID=A0AAN9SVF2_PSOTE
MWKQTALDANQHATISSVPHTPKAPTTHHEVHLHACNLPSYYFVMSILPLIFLPLPSPQLLFSFTKDLVLGIHCFISCCKLI